ncbi:hypothetical protein OGAPHI_004281 [Ogataea philodendri]|uniref:Amino acid transporter transmembrane domain-containing protein n=1 Tax=Ogataea philodendri TaxID=1378263 RepID=A0A9P8P6D8_9ASCO|nr:uncharacterized protein OGAPHI_004281 [Ogataea philodendri]KAH3666092.1 hypothetical protein OGAPHI_004281 [Ogataea philodendri]
MTKASVSSSVVNTVNTIIGSGMLVLPYAFKTDSVLWGILILIFAAVTNILGLFLLAVSSKYLREGNANFFTVSLITDPSLSVIFDFAIALQCFGVNISYVVLTGDLLPLIFPISGYSDSQARTFYILLSAFITVPLCFLKRLDSLKYASVVSLVAIAYLVILVYANFGYALATGFENVPIDKQGTISWWKPEGFKQVFKTFAIIVLAFTCPNEFSIISELDNPTLSRILKIIAISLSVTTALFVTVGLSGYFTFGSSLTGNIILMYQETWYTKLGMALLALMVLLSFPLMFHPARISFHNISHWIETTYIRSEESTPLIESEAAAIPLSQSRFVKLTIIMLIVAYFAALKLKSFELVLSIVGSTGGVLISFVLPGFYGYKLINNAEKRGFLEIYSPEDSGHWVFRNETLKKLSLALVFWGIAVMFISLYSTLFE